MIDQPIEQFDIDLAREHAELVAVGVREIAEVGSVRAEPDSMLRAATILEQLAPHGATAFVVPTIDGLAVCGFAAHEWSLDLYQWALSEGVPQKQRARIVGLLHGYSGEAVREFEARGCGRRWPTTNDSSGSGGRAST
jgi:hypothetical protein